MRSSGGRIDRRWPGSLRASQVVDSRVSEGQEVGAGAGLVSEVEWPWGIVQGLPALVARDLAALRGPRRLVSDIHSREAVSVVSVVLSIGLTVFSGLLNVEASLYVTMT